MGSQRVGHDWATELNWTDWALKNWCCWTVVLEKTLESPLGSKEIQPVNPKGNEPWIFIARTVAEAEAPILWPPDVKSQLIGRNSDAGKEWRQEEKRWQRKMFGWHHRLNGHEYEQTLWDGEGQGSLACCNLRGCKESDRTKGPNNNNELTFFKTVKKGKDQAVIPPLLH